MSKSDAAILLHYSSPHGQALKALDPTADPVAAVELAYERLGELGDNPVFIHVVPKETALARARDLQHAARKDFPLRGLPFAVKDNIDVAGLPTTAGCPEFAYTPAKSATAAKKLLDAGAILIGKTNLDQFATGLVGTRSPYVCAFSLGTDTAGSGRVPAAFNALVGLKPTRGRVSMAGVVPACRSLDCVSIFARSRGPAAASRCGARRRAARSRILRRRGICGLVRGRYRPHAGAGFLRRARGSPSERRRCSTSSRSTRKPFIRSRAAFSSKGTKYSAVDAFRGQYRLAAPAKVCGELWKQAAVLMVPGAPTIYTIEEVQANPLELNARLGSYTISPICSTLPP